MSRKTRALLAIIILLPVVLAFVGALVWVVVGATAASV